MLTDDANFTPPKIRYPQDGSLLAEARENTERIIDITHNPKDGTKTGNNPMKE